MTPVDELRQQWADAMATYGAVNVPPIEFLAHMIRISGEMQIELIERQDRTNALLERLVAAIDAEVDDGR